jgi:ribosomal protein S24E
MAFKILSDKENKLLKRKELTGEIVFSGATPSNEHTRKEVAAAAKVPEDAVVVKRILCDFGSTKANVSAYAYATKADLEATEPKKKEKKAKPGEAPAETPAEAAK